MSVTILLAYLAPGCLPQGAPLSQCAWVSYSLFDPSDTRGCIGARLLGSMCLNGPVYNFMIILTHVNNNGGKNNLMCRMALAGWVGLSGRGVGYGWCEASLEFTLTQHPVSESQASWKQEDFLK